MTPSCCLLRLILSTAIASIKPGPLPQLPCRGGEMADAAVLKSASRKGVWVQIPPSALHIVS